MNDGPTLRVVLCSCPPDRRDELVGGLLDARLAACVSSSSVRSSYRWQGEICHEEESLLVIKTTADRLDALREHLVAAHPYEVPEIVVLHGDAAASHLPYVDWVREETRPQYS
jgi:periplasmic divalent cation tolerance protein